jgi:riboflavin kinase
MTEIILKGTVAAGVGGGKDYLDGQPVKQAIEAVVGFKPFSGTLNVRLSEESALKRLELHQDKEDGIRPQVGSFPGALIKARIGPFDCAIIHPEDPGYPEDIIEVIAPVNLREKLNLSDGSQVIIVAYDA